VEKISFLTTNPRTFRLQEFVRSRRIADYRLSKMSTDATPQVSHGGTQPCLALVPELRSNTGELDLVQFTLKVRAGSGANAPAYKRKVARFDSGTPAEWIEVLEALEEIFAQNSLNSAEDRDNIIKTVLRGDSLTAYESSVQEQHENPGTPDRPLPLTLDIVKGALTAVSRDVFPHRALFMQKRWMKRLKKPADMPIRKFVAAVVRMNSKLIRFPDASEADLFSSAELLEILEFAIPNSWRVQCNRAGYIPSDFDRTRLVSEGEQIERAELLTKAAAPSKPKAHSAVQGKSTPAKSGSSFQKGKKKGNPASGSGATSNQNPAKGGGSGQTFSGNKFGKELYAMSKGKDRIEVIDQYSAILKWECKRAQRKAAQEKKRKAKGQAAKSTKDSSEEDSDVSVHVMDAEEVKQACWEDLKRHFRATMDRHHKRKVTFNPEDQLEEEAAFKKTCQGTDSEESEAST